jgi:hypothetical protein
MDRSRRRLRRETVGVIVLTLILAVCGASLAAVAVSLSGQGAKVVSRAR